MFGTSSGTYKDYTEVPYLKMEGERGALKVSGSDSEEEDDRQGNENAKKAVDGVKQDIAPSQDKQGVKAGDDLKTIRSVTKGSVHGGATILCMDMLQN